MDLVSQLLMERLPMFHYLPPPSSSDDSSSDEENDTPKKKKRPDPVAPTPFPGQPYYRHTASFEHALFIKMFTLILLYTSWSFITHSLFSLRGHLPDNSPANRVPLHEAEGVRGHDGLPRGLVRESAAGGAIWLKGVLGTPQFDNGLFSALASDIIIAPLN